MSLEGALWLSCFKIRKTLYLLYTWVNNKYKGKAI
jgi:hypothetical protein